MGKTTDLEMGQEGRRRRQRGYVNERRAYLNHLKLSAGCVDCGYRRSPAALHFDHVRGVKFFSIGHSMTISRARLAAELKKCEVRCANCHAERTAERRT